MITKILYKINSREFNNQHEIQLDMNSTRQETCSLRDEKIVTKNILEDGIHSVESTFFRKEIADVILSNITSVA